jgi:hypothetical protein
VRFLRTSCEVSGKMGPMATVPELATWVREELTLDPGQSVDIAELPGTDPRCSPIVTQVAIGPTAESPAYSFHIERPLDELVRMDLVAALAFGGGH